VISGFSFPLLFLNKILSKAPKQANRKKQEEEGKVVKFVERASKQAQTLNSLKKKKKKKKN
jgi:hypothetical protein